MTDIELNIFKNEKHIAFRTYPPQSAEAVKAILLDEDVSWTGTLRKAGSPKVLTGSQWLEGGAHVYTFHIQRQSELLKMLAKS